MDLRLGWLSGEWIDKHTVGWTDGKSPHSTGLCLTTAQLRLEHNIGRQHIFFWIPDIKRGKGTADHMMPLGDWFLCYSGTPV